jgi:hypothetical protein
LAVERDLLFGDVDDDLERALRGRLLTRRFAVVAPGLAMRLAIRFGRARGLRVWIFVARLVREIEETGACRRARRQQEREPGGQRRLR